MHLQANTLFDLDIGVKVTQNITQYPLHHVSYSDTKFEAATSNGLGGDVFTKIHNLIFDLDLRVKVTRNFAQYPLLYVTLSGTKFEDAKSNGLGSFTRKYIILHLTLI